MKNLSTTFQISIGLVGVMISFIFAAQVIGVLPDANNIRLAGRARLAETIAVHCSMAVQRRDLELLRNTLQAAVARDPELLSAGVKKKDGEFLEYVADENQRNHKPELLVVPVSAANQAWGTVELGYMPNVQSGFMAILLGPATRFVLFMAGLSGLGFFLYLRRVLQHLDPSKVVPQRVRTTLDTLAEGLVVLDNEQRIILANRVFAETVGIPADELQGRSVEDFAWREGDVSDPSMGPKTTKPGNDLLTSESLPWTRSMDSRAVESGRVLKFVSKSNEERLFKVNSSPIIDENGECHGVLASFDDVSVLEKRNQALTEMLTKLEHSRDHIRKQNHELQILATRDPLTSALNRRSFFEQFDICWSESASAELSLSCIMLDIDYFKSINDNYGHAAGDFVLQKTVSLLHNCGREHDLVCRYGGEEFCVLLPNTDLRAAAKIAERLRQEIQTANFDGISVTASLGVSSTMYEAESPQELLDQADQSLYAAKRMGRNQVVSWPEIPSDVDATPEPSNDHERESAETEKENVKKSRPAVSFQTVSALISALAYRDADTAEHSRRVGDLCVEVANSVMPLSESYILENAALLHDIGKIGVPDNILLKPGPLDEKEWEVMNSHDRIGVEIIRSTFACKELTEMVLCHHATYQPNPKYPELPSGKDIPLGARILTIADAYDAMVSDRVYRKGMSQDEAFKELRRCAGRQFDPDLVERFIEVISAKNESMAKGLSVVDDVNKATALRLGVQIEKLAQALDRRDAHSLVQIAQQLQQTARKHEVAPIADLAAELIRSAEEDDQWITNLRLTIDLMELCRQTQRSHLNTEAGRKAPALAMACSV